MSLLLFLGDVFSIAGGVFNWDWFMNDHKAYMAVKLFGRNGARIFLHSSRFSDSEFGNFENVRRLDLISLGAGLGPSGGNARAGEPSPTVDGARRLLSHCSISVK